jgi:hypothetical protein
MEATVSEIANGIYRISTFVPAVAPPAGFTFNQFLVVGDEPLLFHTGPRRMFATVRDAVAKVFDCGYEIAQRCTRRVVLHGGSVRREIHARALNPRRGRESALDGARASGARHPGNRQVNAFGGRGFHAGTS